MTLSIARRTRWMLLVLILALGLGASLVGASPAAAAHHDATRSTYDCDEKHQHAAERAEAARTAPSRPVEPSGNGTTGTLTTYDVTASLAIELADSPSGGTAFARHGGDAASLELASSVGLHAPKGPAVRPALPAGSGTRANHHIFPQQFRERFSQAGVDIDDFTVGVDHPWEHLRGIHGRGVPTQGMPGRWNQRWGEFFDANPNASAKDIYQFGGRLMDEFGLSGRPIVPYK